MASLLPWAPGASAATVPLLAENQARFGAIEGDVGFLPQGAAEWQTPTEGLPLEPGDQIRTAEDGRVELRMSAYAVWVLEPNSQAAAESMDDHSGRLNLVHGALLGRVNSQDITQAQQWIFNTPAAVVAVRGTEFSLEYAAPQGAALGVFEGQVDFQAAETAAGESPVVRVGAGEEAVLKRGAALQKRPLTGPRRAWRERLPDLRARSRRVQEGWSHWNPEDRRALRKNRVAPPPKRKPRRVREPRLKYGPKEGQP